jgi:hypothetical protein
MAASDTMDNPVRADIIGKEASHYIEALLTAQLTDILSHADVRKEGDDQQRGGGW